MSKFVFPNLQNLIALYLFKKNQKKENGGFDK